jgi:hypothetical protein
MVTWTRTSRILFGCRVRKVPPSGSFFTYPAQFFKIWSRGSPKNPLLDHWIFGVTKHQKQQRQQQKQRQQQEQQRQPQRNNHATTTTINQTSKSTINQTRTRTTTNRTTTIHRHNHLLFHSKRWQSTNNSEADISTCSTFYQFSFG